MRRFAALSLAEQALFSGAGFVVTAVVVRTGSDQDIADFGLAYQAALGLLALLSEAFVTPLLMTQPNVLPAAVAAATNALRWFSVLSGLLAASLYGSLPSAAYILVVLSIAGAGLAYSTARALDYRDRLASTNVKRSALRLAFSIPLLFAVQQSSPSALGFLLVLASGFVLADLAGVRRAGAARRANAPLPAQMLRRAWAWPAITGMRVLGFGLAPLAILKEMHGAAAASVVITALAVVAPVQLLSAVGGNLVLPRVQDGSLRDAITDRVSGRRLLVLIPVAGLLLLLALPLWARLLLGTEAAGRLEQPALLAVLAVTIVLSSVLSLNYRITSTPGRCAVHVAVAAASGVAAALSGRPLLSLVLPYLVFTSLAGVATWRSKERSA